MMHGFWKDDLPAHTFCTGALWCAFGVDAAGTTINPENDTGRSSLQKCVQLCADSPSCAFMSYDGATLPDPEEQHLGDHQQPVEEEQCALRKDPFTGVHGWTSSHPSMRKADSWNPNSMSVCFKRVEDWDHMGVLLSKYCLPAYMTS